MLDEKERKIIIEKSDVLKKEISEIKSKLSNLNKQKENWFGKKEGIKKEINKFIRDIKDIKAEKDISRENIRFLKEQRDKYNSEVKNLIKKIKKLDKEKAYAFKKYKINVDPSQIQKRIEDIEKRVETEVRFENEKRLMKEINKLKKVYDEGSEIRSLIDDMNKTSNEITDSKKKADEFHKKIREYPQNKNDYGEFIELSKNVNELRKEEEETFQKFIDFKKQFLDVNNVLKSKINELNSLKQQLDKDVHEIKAKTEEIGRSRLIEKTKNVLDKLRLRKKLTTEDLLVFQENKK